jgi:UDP-GlcNAc:undecaprenyl-phosphate GlcNAc-1-phosphate transferase
MGSFTKMNIPFFLQISLLIGLGFLFAFFGAPAAIKLAKKIGAVDLPDSAAHKRHSVPMPLAGGLLAFSGSWLLFGVFGFWHTDFPFWAVFLGSILIFIFGLLDDIYGLSAPQKLLGQVFAALLLVWLGVSVRFLETVNLPLSRSWLMIFNTGLTLFWLVGVTNAFNLIDSMDGLVAGLTFIIASFFSFITFYSGQIGLAVFSSILIGLSLGLYLHNKQPARFFLGDSGAQLFGFFLAAIALLYRPPDLNPKSTWFIPILLLGIPIFDTTLVTISRLRRHKPVFQADRSHTYHRLVDFGYSPVFAVLLMQAGALLLSFAAFLIMFLSPILALSIFLLILVAGVFLIVFFESRLDE